MPEGLEAEIYRRAAGVTLGRTIDSVEIDDRQQSSLALRAALPGHRIEGVDRHGKVVVLRTDGVDVGVHFGMTGRLIVDDEAAIDRLVYSSGRDASQWDRLRIGFVEGGSIRVNDPRRWARFDHDPDLSTLGPDVLDGVRADRSEFRAEVATALTGRRAVKTVLLDQRRVSGLGNLCVDEVLFHAGISPEVPVNELTAEAVDRLVDAIREHLPAMLGRGGSHTGDLDPGARAHLPPCPLDGVPLVRTVVGGRTTIWCPRHQGE